MAKLAGAGDLAASSSTIPAHTQLLAVAWLRWRMFVNGVRRRPTDPRHVMGLVFIIILRVIVWSILALMVIGPVAGCGFLGWAAVADNHPHNLAPLLAGIFLLWQFFSINGISIAATLSSFDASSLLRFPLPFGRYLLLRTLFGLLTPSTTVGCLMLLAAAIGIGVADHALALPALVVLAVYAWMNVFFTRMVAAWLERWLATRRARELFGVLTIFFVIGIQFLNFRRTDAHAHGATRSWLLNFLQGRAPFLRWLPPGFAANSILLRAHPVAAFVQFTALLRPPRSLLAIFAVRLHKQFLGEHLSEGPARSTAATSASELRRLSQRSIPGAPLFSSAARQFRNGCRPKRQAFSWFSSRENHTSRSFSVHSNCEICSRHPLSPVISACLRKEWIYLRGNGSQLIGVLTPLIFVVLLHKGSLRRPSQVVSSGSDRLRAPWPSKRPIQHLWRRRSWCAALFTRTHPLT